MIFRCFNYLLIGLFFAFSCYADEIKIKDSAPEIYIVKPGDTLWDISSLYLQQPWLWPELWRNNVHLLNPHLIYPGDQLTLRIGDDGEVSLDIVRGPEKRKMKLTPSGKKLIKPAAIELLPWTVIQPYIQNGMILTEQEYQALPQLLGDNDGSVMFVSADNVLTVDHPVAGEIWQVVRKQNQVTDLDGDVLGVQVRHVANAEAVNNQPADALMIELSESNLEARQGDKLIALPAPPQADMVLQAATDLRGTIVDSPDQRLILGKFDVVIIDLGQEQVQPGTVMGIYNQGPDIFNAKPPVYDDEVELIGKWVQGGERIPQPAVKMGELVVFRTFEKASYALITRANKTIRKGGVVARP